jgi:glycosyltransferase involved in cell wall biosynthesis
MSVEERTAFRAGFAQPDQPIVYYVGRLVHEKGVQVLIQAAPQIVQQMPNVKFVIAGTGVCLDELRQLARENNVSDQFVFTGFIADDVRDKLYQVANVAVFPSLYEPFGIVALEAMAYGCPVVASETGGLAEFVRPHQTGILTRCGDPASLAWGILHSLMRPDWTAERARNALAMVERDFIWERIADQTASIYSRAYNEWQSIAWGH